MLLTPVLTTDHRL